MGLADLSFDIMREGFHSVRDEHGLGYGSPTGLMMDDVNDLLGETKLSEVCYAFVERLKLTFQLG